MVHIYDDIYVILCRERAGFVGPFFLGALKSNM